MSSRNLPVENLLIPFDDTGMKNIRENRCQVNNPVAGGRLAVGSWQKRRKETEKRGIEEVEKVRG